MNASVQNVNKCLQMNASVQNFHNASVQNVHKRMPLSQMFTNECQCLKCLQMNASVQHVYKNACPKC